MEPVDYGTLLDVLPPSAAAAAFIGRTQSLRRHPARLASWLAERQRVEAEYAVGLARLAGAVTDDPDWGVLAHGWQAVVAATANVAGAHDRAARALDGLLVKPDGLELLDDAATTLIGAARALDPASPRLGQAQGSVRRRPRSEREVDRALTQWTSAAPVAFARLQTADAARWESVRAALVGLMTGQADTADIRSRAAATAIEAVLGADDDTRFWPLRVREAPPSLPEDPWSEADDTGDGGPATGPSLPSSAPSVAPVQASAPPAPPPPPAPSRFNPLRRLGTVLGRKRSTPTSTPAATASTHRFSLAPFAKLTGHKESASELVASPASPTTTTMSVMSATSGNTPAAAPANVPTMLNSRSATTASTTVPSTALGDSGLSPADRPFTAPTPPPPADRDEPALPQPRQGEADRDDEFGQPTGSGHDSSSGTLQPHRYDLRIAPESISRDDNFVGARESLLAAIGAPTVRPPAGSRRGRRTARSMVVNLDSLDRPPPPPPPPPLHSNPFPPPNPGQSQAPTVPAQSQSQSPVIPTQSQPSLSQPLNRAGPPPPPRRSRMSDVPAALRIGTTDFANEPTGELVGESKPDAGMRVVSPLALHPVNPLRSTDDDVAPASAEESADVESFTEITPMEPTPPPASTPTPPSPPPAHSQESEAAEPVERAEPEQEAEPEPKPVAESDIPAPQPVVPVAVLPGVSDVASGLSTTPTPATRHIAAVSPPPPYAGGEDAQSVRSLASSAPSSRLIGANSGPFAAAVKEMSGFHAVAAADQFDISAGLATVAGDAVIVFTSPDARPRTLKAETAAGITVDFNTKAVELLGDGVFKTDPARFRRPARMFRYSGLQDRTLPFTVNVRRHANEASQSVAIAVTITPTAATAAAASAGRTGRLAANLKIHALDPVKDCLVKPYSGVFMRDSRMVFWNLDLAETVYAARIQGVQSVPTFWIELVWQDDQPVSPAVKIRLQGEDPFADAFEGEELVVRRSGGGRLEIRYPDSRSDVPDDTVDGVDTAGAESSVIAANTSSTVESVKKSDESGGSKQATDVRSNTVSTE